MTLDTFQENRSDEAKLIIVSLSIQPVLSLAKHYNLEPNECAGKLVGYFKMLGADMVVDMTIADDFALIECQREFIQRYTNKDSFFPMLASSCPGKKNINRKNLLNIIPN